MKWQKHEGQKQTNKKRSEEDINPPSVGAGIPVTVDVTVTGADGVDMVAGVFESPGMSVTCL